MQGVIINLQIKLAPQITVLVISKLPLVFVFAMSIYLQFTQFELTFHKKIVWRLQGHNFLLHLNENN